MSRHLSIEPRASGNARLPWVVHIPESDRPRYAGQKRRYFRREGEAATFARILRRLRSDHTAAFSHLPDHKKAQAHEALELLSPYTDVTLPDIVRAYVAGREQAAKSRPLVPLIAELIDSKAADGRRAAYRRDLRSKLGKFAASFPNRLASEITAPEISVWLRDCGLKPRSRDSYRRNIGVFFSWCKEKGYVPSNPVLDVKAINPRREAEVSILMPEQLMAMIRVACPRLRPYLVICAFAGLRPAECQRLPWDAIKPQGIYVPKKITKTTARLVPILPALAEWLQFFGNQSGNICSKYGTWRKDFRACAQAAGLLPWPQDALRHSAISYWLSQEPSRAAVAMWTGNSEEVQRRDYDNPRSPEEAAAWYAVLPSCLRD